MTEPEKPQVRRWTELTRSRGLDGRRIVVACLLGALLLWTYAPALTAMVGRWSDDPKYSHGYLVPLFAAFLLWHRRTRAPSSAQGGSAWGLLGILGACVLSLAAAYLYYGWLDSLGFLVALAAVCLLFGGRTALGWAWPSIAFLVFMLPLPYALEVGLARPLQRVAAISSTYVLQTLGLPAARNGNTILLDSWQIGVAEACSGLGMLITFGAFATAFALLLRRGWGDRVVILMSAMPIAIVANVARIVTAGVLFRFAGRYWADDFFHKKAGWLMMPLALALLWVESWVLARLWLTAKVQGPVPLDLGSTGHAGTGRSDVVPAKEAARHVHA